MSNPYCDVCKHEHGPLYICPHYSEEKKRELEILGEKFRAYLTTDKALEDLGGDEVALSIFKAMAGVE